MKRDLYLISIALFTWGIGESAYYYFQPLYLEQLGASPAAIGTILGGVGIAMTIAHIPAGYLADRIGRRIMLWAAWGCGLLSGFIMAFAKSLPQFTVGILLYGVTAFVVSPLNSYVTAARGKLSVGRVLTITGAAYNGGAIIGPLIGGMIGNQYGLSNIYTFTAVTFAISTFVILFIRSQPREALSQSKNIRGIFNRNFLNYLPLFFIAIFAMYLPQPLSQNYLQNENFLTLNEIGQLGSIASLGSVVMNLGLGTLNAKAGFVFGQIATGLFALVLWKGTNLSWFSVGYFLLGGFRSSRALAVAQIQELISIENMGLAFGIAESVGGAAMIFSPILAGYLYEVSPGLVYMTGIGMIGFSVLLSIIFPKPK